MLKNIRNKSRRRILEAAYIKTSEKAINNKGGFFRLSHPISENIFIACNKNVYNKKCKDRYKPFDTGQELNSSI